MFSQALSLIGVDPSPFDVSLCEIIFLILGDHQRSALKGGLGYGLFVFIYS